MRYTYRERCEVCGTECVGLMLNIQVYHFAIQPHTHIFLVQGHKGKFPLNKESDYPTHPSSEPPPLDQHNIIKIHMKHKFTTFPVTHKYFLDPFTLVPTQGLL